MKVGREKKGRGGWGGNVKDIYEKIGSKKVLYGARWTEGGAGGSKAILAMPIYGNNTFQKGASLIKYI